jgi:hypothetical protein
MVKKMSKTITIDGVEYKKVESVSIEEMMEEFDMTRDEVISATENAASLLPNFICIDGELYREKENNNGNINKNVDN